MIPFLKAHVISRTRLPLFLMYIEGLIIVLLGELVLHYTVLEYYCVSIVTHSGLQHHQRCSPSILGLYLSCCNRSQLPSTLLPPPSLAHLLHCSPTTTGGPSTEAHGHHSTDVYPNEGGPRLYPSLLQL